MIEWLRMWTFGNSKIYIVTWQIIFFLFPYVLTRSFLTLVTSVRQRSSTSNTVLLVIILNIFQTYDMIIWSCCSTHLPPDWHGIKCWYWVSKSHTSKSRSVNCINSIKIAFDHLYSYALQMCLLLDYLLNILLGSTT